MRRFIAGTDWWTDCDDAMAMRLLARAAKRGEIALDGVGINACMPYSCASLREFFALEGLDGVPIGIDREATDYGGRPPYQERLAKRSGDPFRNEQAPDAAELYLSVLRQAAEPVEIVEIGFTQVVAAALKKEPKLFAEKVAHVWMMAGKWDEPNGREYNFSAAPRTSRAAAEFLRGCPAPITFLGFETAVDVIVGGKLAEGDHLRQVLVDHGSPNGRCAWDPMLVRVALRGDPAAAGFTCVTGTASVDPETGCNQFAPAPNGKHRYLVRTRPIAYYEEELNRMIASDNA
ncbi:MAG: nucleoside hydrolase [Clostridia bacterium]|nr:nucleoside hydrolase [Clostridia bacterium]